MVHMKQDRLQDQLPKLDALQSACINCGLCLEACATYQESGWEYESPRGRIRLARNLMDGVIPPESPALESFDRCIGCHACETVCPTFVNYGQIRDLVQEIRSDWKSKNNRGALKEYRKLITAAYRLSSLFWRYYGGYWIVKGAGMNTPHQGSFLKKYSVQPKARGNCNVITLAIGCAQDLFQHELIGSAIKVLETFGFEVHIDRRQPCCGAVFDRLVHGGLESIEYPQEKKRASTYQERCSKQFLKWLPQKHCFLSKGCHSHIKAVSKESNSVDIFALLLQSLNKRHLELTLATPMVVYYQPYCRSNPINADPVLQLMQKIKNLEVRLIESPESCCGGYCGNYLQRSNSENLVKSKVRNLPSDAIIVVSSPDCHGQFSVAKINTQRVMHPIQIIAESLF